jgi:tetratricopeptide (TPR) repeat protein
MVNDDFPKAFDHLRIALGHAPDALELQTTLGIATYLQGSREQGIRHLAEVLELDPDFSFARYELARVLAASDRYAEALEHLDVLRTVESRDTYTALTAYAAGRSGDPFPARRFLELSRHARRPPHYLRAYARMGLGEKSEALGELRAAVEANEPWTILLPLDGIFADLSTERTYNALLPLAR